MRFKKLLKTIDKTMASNEVLAIWSDIDLDNYSLQQQQFDKMASAYQKGKVSIDSLMKKFNKIEDMQSKDYNRNSYAAFVLKEAKKTYKNKYDDKIYDEVEENMLLEYIKITEDIKRKYSNTNMIRSIFSWINKAGELRDYRRYFLCELEDDYNRYESKNIKNLEKILGKNALIKETPFKQFIRGFLYG